MKRWILAGVVLAAVPVIAILAIASLRDQVDSRGPADGVSMLEGAPQPRSDSPRVVARGLGKVEACSEEIGVSSDITGRIAEILVEEGDIVEKDKPLVRLEPFVYRSRVEAAKAA